MFVLIPLQTGNEGDRWISRDFRGAFHVALFDSLTGACSHHHISDLLSGPGGLKENLRRRGVSAVITGHMSPLALRAFAEEGIVCYQSQGRRLEENLNLFRAAALKPAEVDLGACCSPVGCSTCATTGCGVPS